MNSDSIAMWVTRLSIVDWVCSKTRTLLATLRTRNQPRGEGRRGMSYVLLEAEQLSPSVGCARNKRQCPTVLQSLKSFLWILDFAWMEHFVIELLRSTNNTACGTGDHSINKNKTTTPTEKRKRDVEQLSNVDDVPTNTHSSRSEFHLDIFENNESCHQDDHQRTRSNTETRVQNPQSCA